MWGRPPQWTRFASFLTEQGFAVTRAENSASFDNSLVEYSDGQIVVRITSDRGQWLIDVSDAEARPDQRYDPALLRDLMGRQGPDVISLEHQVAIVRSNLETIRSMFSPTRRDETHARLDQIRRDRAERLFPGLLG